MDRREYAHSLLLAGQRDAGLAELEAAVQEARAADDAVLLASLLVDLSYQLRIDNVTGDVHPEHNARCESLLADAESALESSSERPDGWAWLAWHTATRRLLIAQDRHGEAAAVTRRHLQRIATVDDPDQETVDRLTGWMAADEAHT